MKSVLLLLGCLCGLVVGSASAQPAGYVKTVSGQATVTSGARTAVATPGSALAAGDTIRTGPDGALGVTLKDNTVLSFGPSTTFTLEEYLFAPADGKLKFGGRIVRGSMQYISGAIAKLKAEAVEVRTPSGVIGVRGTRFVVVVEE